MELRLNHIAHEIVVVDDGSTDRTAAIVTTLGERIPEARLVKNGPPSGFGRAIACGVQRVSGDAVVIMKGGGVIDYPWPKLRLNRMANLFIRVLFGVSLNDTTNAFKACRRTVIEGCQPLLSAHFNLTVELPLKAIIRGYSWTVLPVTWRNRGTGVAKLKIQEMGSLYLFICLYLWLEKHLRSDYKKGEA